MVQVALGILIYYDACLSWNHVPLVFQSFLLKDSSNFFQSASKTESKYSVDIRSLTHSCILQACLLQLLTSATWGAGCSHVQNTMHLLHSVENYSVFMSFVCLYIFFLSILFPFLTPPFTWQIQRKYSVSHAALGTKPSCIKTDSSLHLPCSWGRYCKCTVIRWLTWSRTIINILKENSRVVFKNNGASNLNRLMEICLMRWYLK